MTNAVRRLAAVFVISGCFAAAQAQTAAEPPPAAEAGTTAQAKCIEEYDGYKMRGRQPIFEVALVNKCDQRIRCKVFVYITSAKGAAQGRGTIVLAPKSRGAAAKGSFTMRAKMNGGSSQSARECRAF